ATLILGEKIMVFVAGPQFFLSGQVLKILIFAAGLIYLSALFGYAVVSCELQKKMIKFYILDTVVSIPLYLIFIPIYSYWAAAIITVLTELIMMASAFYVLKKYTGISLCLKIILKSTGAGLIMAIPLSLLINLNVIVLIMLGLLIYLWALYMLRGVSKQTLMEMVSYKN
ncbi:polysaccharide biosynthesis C-terminal domain-containing protein, partial [Candidatus Falkowbacteria bacterium]|nr:polysaccharide biosynthesis C-terminal domain-containing protein [Candidatus Falkowbacteria bacterium]